MKYKIGDEVLVKAKIVELSSAWTFRIDSNGARYYVKEEQIIPVPDMTAEEAWEIAKKLKRMNKDELWEVFITNDEYFVLKYFTPQQAKAKIEAWEAEKEIKRGDEVVLKDDPNNDEYKFFVTYINKETGKIGGWSGFDGGVFSEIDIRYYKKTGRHIDITGLLEQIGGVE